MNNQSFLVLIDDNSFLGVSDKGIPYHTSFKFCHKFVDNTEGKRQSLKYFYQYPEAKLLRVTCLFSEVD